MKIFTVILAVSLIIFSAIAFAAPSRESGWTSAPPIVAYGKTSAGVLQPILVAADGTLQTA